MHGKNFIAVTAALIFSFCASLAEGKGVPLPATDIGRPESPAFATLNPESTVLAQNDDARADDSERSKSGSETDGSEAAADDEKQSSEDKAKPLEPFVPSEKIPGDQAVDFPVDI
jgi:hypothetical protein